MFSSLTDQFLIAMPGLNDRNFHHSVTYIVEHTEKGAMGIVINHPLEMTLADMLAQLEIEPKLPATLLQRPLYLGGPVQEERGMILHSGRAGQWASSLEAGDSLCVTTSRDILDAIARGEGPEDWLIAVGYAGWAAGQLEQEIAANSWLSGQADSDIIFKLPAEQRWTAAARLIGVDVTLIPTQAGHA